MYVLLVLSIKGKANYVTLRIFDLMCFVSFSSHRWVIHKINHLFFLSYVTFSDSLPSQRKSSHSFICQSHGFLLCTKHWNKCSRYKDGGQEFHLQEDCHILATGYWKRKTVYSASWWYCGRVEKASERYTCPLLNGKYVQWSRQRAGKEHSRQRGEFIWNSIRSGSWLRI